MLFGMFEDWIKDSLLDFLQFVFNTLLSSSVSFWQNEVVDSLLAVVGTIANAVLVLSVLRMLISLAEEASTGTPIPWPTVFTTFCKAFIFANMIVLLCECMYDLSLQLIQSLPVGNLTGGDRWEQLGDMLVSSLPGMTTVALLPYIFILAFLIVGSIVYFVYSLLLFIHMLVHTVNGVLYIPDVTNGDTSAIGAWLRQGIAFSLTFITQSILFYIGMTYIVDTVGIGLDSIKNGYGMLGAACMIGMFAVPKILQKYGYSMGIGGMLRSAGGIVMSGASAFRR